MKRICVNCGKRVENRISCKCGSNFFCEGNNFKIIDKEIICSCKNNKFKRDYLSDAKSEDGSSVILTCTNCFNKLHLEKIEPKEIAKNRLINMLRNKKTK